jgi:SAM-dependent methyltransferase
MSMSKLAVATRDVLISRLTSGGTQNFLGAFWIERLISATPPHMRERVALRLLSLSPHYFYDHDLKAESNRNRQSRQILADALIAPHLSPGSRVLDYGCGPGYLAAAVSPRAAHVDAIDISRGVLACARTLNGRGNITYRTPAQFSADGTVDLAYSFAVVQHLRAQTLAQALGLLAAAIRPGGLLVMHFAVPGEMGWRTEADWLADFSLTGRAKLRYGLNCFGRTEEDMVRLVAGSGFTDPEVRRVSELVDITGEDVTSQHLLTARRAMAAADALIP